MTRRRKLAKQDEELWTRVTRNVTPLNPERLIKPTADVPEPRAEPKPSRTDTPIVLPSYSPPVSMSRSTGSDLDRPAYKKLAKGKSAIDARIDLHGMTQSVAHHRLANFIADCRHSGLRHVLIITGKGSSSGGDGVLRRMVPLWLNTEPMKRDVSGFSSAARHHGGDGALYVRLKRR